MIVIVFDCGDGCGGFGVGVDYGDRRGGGGCGDRLYQL